MIKTSFTDSYRYTLLKDKDDKYRINIDEQSKGIIAMIVGQDNFDIIIVRDMLNEIIEDNLNEILTQNE